MRGLREIVAVNGSVGGVGGCGAGAMAQQEQQDAAASAAQPERRVNILQITIVHDVGRGMMAGTATTPYLEDPSDPAIVAVRNHLVSEFARITAPVKPGEVSPVWGEWTEAPGDAPAPEKVRIAGDKPSLILAP